MKRATSAAAAVAESESPQSRKPPEPRSEIIFTSLAHLRPGPNGQPAYYNVLGLIREASSLRPTQGTDHSCVVTLLDATCGSLEETLSVNLFVKRLEEAPDLSPGRLLRITHMRLDLWQGRIKGVAWTSGGLASCVSLPPEESEAGDSISPVGSRVRLSEGEVALVRALRTWARLGMLRDLPLAQAEAEHEAANRYRRRLAELRAGESHDVVAQVRAIERPRPGHVLLALWDGSTPEPVPLLLDEMRAAALPPALRSGDFIKLRNVRPLVTPTQRIELVAPNSFYITRLDPGHPLLRQLPLPPLLPAPPLRSVDQRQLCSRILRPEHAAHPRSCISDILNHHNPTGLFLLEARVVGHLPLDLRDFTRPLCPACQRLLNRSSASASSCLFFCSSCQISLSRSEVLFEYAFQLRLDDGSGRLRVILYGVNARKFLKGAAATDLYNSKHDLNVLRLLISRLMSGDSRLLACIMSYLVYSQQGDHLPVRRYQIFDTEIS